MKRISAVMLLFIGVLLFSCEKNNTDSSSVLQVKMQATNKSSAILKSATLVTPLLNWDVCTMNVSHIEFKAEGKETENAQNSYKVSYEWRGSKVINLFDATSVVGDIVLDPGVYDEIQLEIEAAKSQNSTVPVFYLAGTYTNAQGTVIPIEITMNEDFKFEVEKEGTTLDGTNDYSALVNLNLALLMSSVSESDLGAATLTDGKIIVNATSNPNIYLKIKSKVSSCEDVEYDHHGDDDGHGDD
jgi:hypothetical protein